MPAYPLINSMEYSFASITMAVDGQEYLNFQAINYNDSLTPGRSGGASPVPFGTTAGEWDGSGSVEMALADGHALIASLGDGWGLRSVVFSVVFAEEGRDTHEHVIRARLSRADNSNTRGSEPTKMVFDLFILEPIQRDGYRIVPLPSAAGAVGLPGA